MRTVIDFTVSGDRNPNVKGNGRLLIITDNGDSVRLEVKAEALGRTTNDGLLTLSDVTIPKAVYDAHKDVILAATKGGVA